MNPEKVQKTLDRLIKLIHEETKNETLLCCSAISDRGFLCTRKRGHFGRHIATAGSEIADIWNNAHNKKKDR